MPTKPVARDQDSLYTTIMMPVKVRFTCPEIGGKPVVVEVITPKHGTVYDYITILGKDDSPLTSSSKHYGDIGEYSIWNQ